MLTLVPFRNTFIDNKGLIISFFTSQVIYLVGIKNFYFLNTMF